MAMLCRSVLENGFDFEGTRVPLIGPQGIFKPAVLDLPLTFTTVPIIEGRRRPYEDEVGNDGLIRYRYRGIDPQHRDNVGLRTCMQRQIPLIYLYAIVPGRCGLTRVRHLPPQQHSNTELSPITRFFCRFSHFPPVI